MWVKICGITRREDAVAACEAGADALGFVLTKSPRRADPRALMGWIRLVMGVEKVGVFTDEPLGYIEEVSTLLGLDTVQLHTQVRPGHGVLRARFKIIRAVKSLDEAALDDPTDRILFDASMGTGTRGTWTPSGVPFILAGGLTPENVRQAIMQANPAGVDVSSGVEVSPGIKDAAKMGKFIQEARS
ncbi:MAG TPA: phosphoribosylanthranilate isomerase [Deltaproteobacteria bacterium]|nr:phosphoribosylanthranilate isomerase [Deltaproteobacteria bacterium]HOI05872.1 phosphoribosylanthranilate isomerase [Deltaproteobacteria bacterium]